MKRMGPGEQRRSGGVGRSQCRAQPRLESWAIFGHAGPLVEYPGGNTGFKGRSNRVTLEV